MSFRSFQITLAIAIGAACFSVLFMLVNGQAFWHTMGEVHDGVAELFQLVIRGVSILFLVGLTLGVAWIIWHFKREQNIIRPGKYGPAQAIVYQGQLIQLSEAHSQLDPMQHITYMQKLLQLTNAANKHMHCASEEPPRQLEPPKDEGQETIPAVISYEEIREQIPEELTLLGIRPEDGTLEIVSSEMLKTAWFVGGSNTGKTNTVYGKVADCIDRGFRLAICDNHANKLDSLANKLKDFHGRLLMPIAQTDEDIKRTIMAFLHEFHQRRDHGRSCEEKWLIVNDEVNATGNHVVKLAEEEEKWLYDCYGIKVKDHQIKLMTFFKILAETCGYEARGFGMYGFFITQRVAGVAWLRNAMMTIFVHGLLTDSEALLAANNNRKRAEEVKKFKKGRTLVYGYEIEEMVLQQPLYEGVVDSISAPVSNRISELYPDEEINSSMDTDVDQPGKQPDTETGIVLSQAQKIKLLQVLELDAQQKGQNDIIRTIWGQEPNTRAGQASAEELRLIRAYIAQEQRKQLGV